MRFFLDNDVPVSVGTMLRGHGHESWTAGNAGLATEKQDDALTAYADEKHAVLVTFDVEFSTRRYANAYGHHVWLHCLEFEAAAVLEARLDEVLDELRGREHVTLRVSKAGIRAESDWR